MLGAFDNYNLGYVDRGFALAPEFERRVNPGGGIVRPSIVVDGRFVGTWASKRAGRRLAVTIEPFAALAPEVETRDRGRGRRHRPFRGPRCDGRLSGVATIPRPEEGSNLRPKETNRTR